MLNNKKINLCIKFFKIKKLKHDSLLRYKCAILLPWIVISSRICNSFNFNSSHSFTTNSNSLLNYKYKYIFLDFVYIKKKKKKIFITWCFSHTFSLLKCTFNILTTLLKLAHKFGKHSITASVFLSCIDTYISNV